MKFKTLKGINIYSYLKFYVDFLDFTGSTTIILGKNLDQKTANAAGKTSILKTLYWALWNKELDGANIESMICRVAGNGMAVVLEFDDRGNSYKITRWKDHKPNSESPKLHDGTPISGSGVEFLINGEAFNGESHAQTQKIIEQKLRMTPRLFLSAVLSAQDGTNHFLTANDTDKKELLSELLDLQAYQKAFDNIKKEIKTQEDHLAILESRIENLQEQIKAQEDQVMGFLDKEKAYEDQKVLDLNRLTFERDGLIKEIKEIKEIAAQGNPTTNLREQIKTHTERFNVIKKEADNEVKASQALISFQGELKALDEKIVSLKETNLKKEADTQKIKESMTLDPTFDESPLKEAQAKSLTLQDELKSLSSKEREKHSLEMEQVSLTQALNKIQEEINQSLHEEKEVRDNAICTSCKRKFQAGESANLDELLKGIQEVLKQEEEKKKSLETKLSEVVLKLQGLVSLDETRQNIEKNIKDNGVLISDQEKLRQEYALLKQKQDLWQMQIKALEKEQEDNTTQISMAEEKTSKIQGKILVLEEMIASLAPLKQEGLTIESKLQELQNQLVEAEVLAQKILEARRRYQEKMESYNKNKKELEDLTQNPNPFTEIITKLNNQKDSYLKRLKGHKEEILKVQEELKYLNFWRVGFAPTGIRSFITDDVIELLNRKTQENLNDLFDGALSVVFDPESKNNKGIVSNKISTFFILNGKETPFELLSGGEKRRAILATDLALTDIAEARAGTKLNVRFLDEPFNGIDDNGQIKSLVLFSRLAREKDGFFIISHEEKFQNLCQKAMYVVKEREVSRIVDRNTFMSIDIEKQDAVMEDTDSNNRIQSLIKKKKKKADEED